MTETKTKAPEIRCKKIPLQNTVTKTPTTYYGGKQKMLRHILPLIPTHKQYVEAFAGGGAVFWAKPPSEVEVVNDLNRHAVNFYEVLKTDFEHLNRLIQMTLHSEAQHRESRFYLESVESTCKIRRAWAFWMQCNMSFSSAIFGGFAFSNCNATARKITNKKAEFTVKLAERLENTQIFCRDAVDLIKLKDREDTFFYLDPPYFNSDCGHYKGYSQDDFERLLQVLEAVKGKFLLSSYDSDILQRYIAKNGWKVIQHEKPLAVSHLNAGKRKIECLTMNY